ncbi:hypothetical protein [Asticcacaulis benevestitus]|uniref:Uncharacterized protein n=1 Tax=Asticcacaulis benevestitus DSM 16100 = ATCC BAA-896 TaxID=1121022 RepID=V4R202_9CAUL|nr:hypothetical protein [Asticcacaulis benevestitus]ESQ85463.1 hypothetical protein ABENE_18895 [Asticcacaulis benevestitus DSM 16100 = ATCC BAA-896]
MTPVDLFHGLTAEALALAGALALRRAWIKPDGLRPWLIAGGWLLWLVAVLFGQGVWGSVLGIAIVVSLICMTGALVVLSNVERRNVKTRMPREAALEPSDRKRVMWRGWLRGVLAGPLAGMAALGVGLAIAICSPGPPQTRMVIGGLLVPFLWAGGMAWTLSDNKIIRATCVLVGVAAVSLGAAFLKGSIA